MKRTLHEHIIGLDIRHNGDLNLVRPTVPPSSNDDVALGLIDEFAHASEMGRVDDRAKVRVVRHGALGRRGELGESGLEGRDELRLHLGSAHDVVWTVVWNGGLVGWGREGGEERYLMQIWGRVEVQFGGPREHKPTGERT